ncbi:MAG: hypothetical protein WC783_00150 [Candidatus Paceibacterota bacterium]|jgi:hypothetical protein
MSDKIVHIQFDKENLSALVDSFVKKYNINLDVETDSNIWYEVENFVQEFVDSNENRVRNKIEQIVKSQNTFDTAPQKGPIGAPWQRGRH